MYFSVYDFKFFLATRSVFSVDSFIYFSVNGFIIDFMTFVGYQWYILVFSLMVGGQNLAFYHY